MKKRLEINPFYWTALKLALPITLQQIVTSSSSIVDNLMVSVLGTKSIGAVGAVGKFLQIYIFAVYGVSSAGASFITQFWARKDEKGIQRIMGATLFCNLLMAIFFTWVSIFNKDRIVSMFTEDVEIQKMATNYLFVISFSYIFHAISFTYSFALRSIKKASLSLYIIVLSQSLNVFLNYVLISGKVGFPAMGVGGAALASVLAKVVEMFALLFFVYRGEYPIAGSLKSMFDFPSSFFNRFIQIALPLTLNEILWSAGLAAYQVFFGKMGADAMAAYSMVAPFEQFFITAFIGLSSAALVMVGEQLGNDDKDTAYAYALKFYNLSVGMALLIGGIVALFSHKIILIYSYMGEGKVGENTLMYGVHFLRILGIFLFVRIYNLISYAGILKSGGDSLFLFISETGSLWLVGVPLAYLASNVFNMEPQFVYLALYFEEGLKAIFIGRRFISKKWIRNLIDV